jgi:hypothetical protein
MRCESTGRCPPTTPAETAADFLDAMASQLDRWAQQSELGGWSTHQVDGNRR